MIQRQFIKHIDVNEINEDIINDLHSGVVSLYVVENANEDTVELFGDLINQDMYGRKRVTIGHDDEHGKRLNHAHDMLWHQDRAYSKDCHPYVGLFCIRADQGSSPTWFADMQEVYDISSQELKIKAQDVKCMNTITKYMSKEEYPFKFDSPVHERAWRMKNRAQHDLVKQDDTGKYYFYSEAYTETDLESELQKVMENSSIYQHYWKPNQLLVYNNYKTVHKRDSTPDTVIRQHIRYALTKK